MIPGIDDNILMMAHALPKRTKLVWRDNINMPAGASHSQQWIISTGGIYVVGGTGGYIYVSNDKGLTWETASSPNYPVNEMYLPEPVYTGTRFLSLRDGYVMYSFNGYSWVKAPYVSYMENMSGMFYAAGTVIAYGTGGVNYSEDDGNSWTFVPVVDGHRNRIVSMTYGNGEFVGLMHDNDKAAYSTDGKSWSFSTIPVKQGWWDIAFGGGKFVAVNSVTGHGGITAVSENGRTWVITPIPSDKEPRLNRITYGLGRFVAVSFDSANVIESTNGVDWTHITDPIGRHIAGYGGTFDGERLLFKGYSGTTGNIIYAEVVPD